MNFHDGTTLSSVAGLAGTLNGVALTPTQLASIVVTAGNTTDSTTPVIFQGYLEIVLPALSIATGNSAVLTGTLVTSVPEPSTWGLLGLGLLLIGLIRIERVRLFKFRSMGCKLAA